MNTSACLTDRTKEQGSALLLAVLLVALLLPLSLFFSGVAHQAAEYRKITRERLELERTASLHLAQERKTTEGAPALTVPLNSAALVEYRTIKRGSFASVQRSLLVLEPGAVGLRLPNWTSLLRSAKPGCAAYSAASRSTTGYPRQCAALVSGETQLVVAGNLITAEPLAAPESLIVLGDIQADKVSIPHQAATTLFALGKITIGQLDAVPGAGPIFIGSAASTVKIRTLRGIASCRLTPRGPAESAPLAVQSPALIEIDGARQQKTAGCTPQLDPNLWRTVRIIGIGDA